MSKPGKKTVDAQRRYDREQLFAPTEALELVKTMATRKFDESVEAAFRLGVDPRKADQMIRGTVSLPNGTGKSARVAVFAQGDAAREAQEAGADFVGSDDLIAQVEGGMLDFDVAIATPDLMGQVGKLGRTLGPRGLMPNPKTGTVTNEVGKTVAEFKAGQGRVPHRPLRQRARARSARPASRPRRWSRTTTRCSTSCSGPSRRRRRVATCRASRRAPRWAPG